MTIPNVLLPTDNSACLQYIEVLQQTIYDSVVDSFPPGQNINNVILTNVGGQDADCGASLARLFQSNGKLEFTIEVVQLVVIEVLRRNGVVESIAKDGVDQATDTISSNSTDISAIISQVASESEQKDDILASVSSAITQATTTQATNTTNATTGSSSTFMAIFEQIVQKVVDADPNNVPDWLITLNTTIDAAADVISAITDPNQTLVLDQINATATVTEAVLEAIRCVEEALARL